MPGLRFITRGLSLSWAIHSWQWQFNAYRIDMYYYHVHKNQWGTFIDPGFFDGNFPKARTLLSSSRSNTDKDRKFTSFILWDSLWLNKCKMDIPEKDEDITSHLFVLNSYELFASEPEWVNWEGALPFFQIQTWYRHWKLGQRPFVGIATYFQYFQIERYILSTIFCDIVFIYH